MDLPAIPFEAWRPTKDTLHRYAQIVGKIRLALAPWRNHWWHVSLRPTPRGLTTGLMPHRGGAVEIELDLVNHGVDLRTDRGESDRFPLREGLSVAGFHRALFERLRTLGVDVRIRPVPYDLDSAEPFAKDETHASYDADAVARFGTALRWTAGVLEEFAGRFVGKSSPVHFFWHSFDLAHTRFSGRAAPPRPDATPVEAEAYTQEVASFGFWPGDEDVRFPAFYGYAAPAPEALAKEPLTPASARWSPDGGPAVLAYDDVRAAPDPRATLLDFLESVQRAARAHADWSRAEPRA
jgi:hypothetical protein